MRSNWLELLFTDKPLQEQRYLQTLVDVVIGIYRNGGVIVGRGANFILDGTPALRVRIVGLIVPTWEGSNPQLQLEAYSRLF